MRNSWLRVKTGIHNRANGKCSVLGKWSVLPKSTSCLKEPRPNGSKYWVSESMAWKLNY